MGLHHLFPLFLGGLAAVLQKPALPGDLLLQKPQASLIRQGVGCGNACGCCIPELLVEFAVAVLRIRLAGLLPADLVQRLGVFTLAAIQDLAAIIQHAVQIKLKPFHAFFTLSL